MFSMTLMEVAKTIGGQTNIMLSPSYSIYCNGVSTDTRTLVPGNIFFALPGPNYDANNLVAQAQSLGASAAVVQRVLPELDLPCIVVPDTVAALGVLAQHWRRQFPVCLIGVTGSNGKTTIKTMLGAILAASCELGEQQVLVSYANFNNHIGVPLNLFKLHDQHKYAVIEMGMSNFGEINYLAHLAQPASAIISNAGYAHLRNLGDVAGVAKAKGEILTALPPGGSAILNIDDDYYDYWAGLASHCNIYTFGWHERAMVRGRVEFGDEQPELTIITPQGEVSMILPLLGRHNMTNALAAAAAAYSLGVNLATIKAGLIKVNSVSGRLAMRHYPDHNIKLIDDSYNANYHSVLAAITTLADYSGKKIMVVGDLGDMPASSEFNERIYRDLAQAMQAAQLDYVLTYGDGARHISNDLGEIGEHCLNYDDIVTKLTVKLTRDAVILVKGCRAMGLEQVVERLATICGNFSGP